MNQQSKPYTDDEILEAIRSRDGKQIDRVFRALSKDSYLLGAIQPYIPIYRQREPRVNERFLCEVLAIFYQKADDGTFDPANETSIRTYIVGVAKKKGFTDHRSNERFNTRTGKVQENDPENPLINDHYFDPETELTRKEKEGAIETSLKAIGERCRQILTMWSQKYTYQEIADARKISRNTVRDAIPECQDRLHQYLVSHPELLKIINGK